MKNSSCAVSGPPRAHREGAVEMFESRIARAFQRDRLREFLFFEWVGRCLDDLNLDSIVRLVVQRDGAMKKAVGIQAFVDIVQEVGHRFRRLGRIKFDFEIASGGLD